nr:hypothetical protein [Tanacetum cinerariifolium]
MFLTHSDDALESEKFKRSRENIIEYAYDYGNLNASYVNEKINFKDDYFQEIINPDFEKIDSPFQQTSLLKPYILNVILEKIIIDLEDEVVNLLEKEKENMETIESLKSKGFESSEIVISKSKNQNENDCHVNEKECDKEENPKVIAPGMFKLSMSQCVSSVLMSKSSCESNNVEIKLKRKRRNTKSSKQNDKQVNNDVSRANSDVVYFLDLDTFSSVRKPKQSGVIWKKKWSSNTSNVALSSVSQLILNKDVKRYSRKDLFSCNNSHPRETSSAFVCNDAMNVSCNSSMGDLLDDNNFFIFYDKSVRISHVSKMPIRKKPRDYMNVAQKKDKIAFENADSSSRVELIPSKINDDVSNDDDDDVNSDADGDNEASDSERTDSYKDKNLNLNHNNNEEEEYEEEYVHTPDNYEFYDDDDDEEYEELYKDVNVRLKDAEHKERKGDAEMTDVGRDD